MKAFKVFNSDWTCKDFQYEVGKEYKIDSEPILCEKGFHACKKLIDCFSYYSFNSKNKVAEVELLGTVLGNEEDKQVANHIKIVKELSWHEVLDMVNTGNYNSGDCNTGNHNSGDWNAGNYNSGDFNIGNLNSGDCNTGNYNSGDWNTGNFNSGDWNSCDREGGYFNSKNAEEIRVFNKNCSLSLWEKVEKPAFIYFRVKENMSYKDCFKQSYEDAKKRGNWEEEKELLISLPNFDKEVFFEISGIDIELD